MTKIALGPWKEWFAWYPVQVVTETEIIDRERITEFGWYNYRPEPMRTYHWAWMRRVWRRKTLGTLRNGRYHFWEYDDRNVFEILSENRD